MSMFQSLFLKTDVTAIRIWKNFIFASIGGYLSIYELHSSSLLLKQEIFEGQKIYDIQANLDGTKLIIYGGKNIALVSNFDNFTELSVIKSLTLSDWILDAKWIENYTKIVTVFMHNKVTLWTQNFTSELSTKCEERCILYSAHICCDSFKDIIILSGTVFSEILIWKPYYRTENGLSPVLKRLRQHKGVIFSLHCNLTEGLICSTSDDRSAILWNIVNRELLQELSPSNSDLLEVTPGCQVYGHLSRVFRCFILSDSFVTAGEDSLLIFWSFEGNMLRKIETHQGGPIWSLDCSSSMDIICTGSNNGGISLFKINPRILTDIICLPNAEVPKVIGIFQSGNMVCLSEAATVYYYNKAYQDWHEIARHLDLKSYSIMQTSPCKKMVALAGFQGQIYIYYETGNTIKCVYTYSLKSQARIFSFHWITCKTFLVCQSEGKLQLCFLYKQKSNPIQTFILPQSKERWSTCACYLNGHIVVGDRKGNIYNFILGKQHPVNFLKRSHNHLGVTRLYTNNDIIISLGRDGLIKRYKLFSGHLRCLDSNKTKFSWLAALNNNYLLSFSGENFVISDCRLQRVLYETYCGGGHRSWDYLCDSEIFLFCFVKQKVLNIVKLSVDDILPKDIVQGYHVHEINCVKALNFNETNVLISGGEDTYLRISLLDNNSQLKILENLKVHLSSIRSIFLYRLAEADTTRDNNEYLLFTAGGRAQIICWHICLKINNSGSKSIECYEKYNLYEPVNSNEAETRIMDLSVLNINKQISLFAGSSNGYIKVYLLSENMELKYQKSIFCTTHSITKIVNIFILNRPLLLSMNTDGIVMFWNILQINSVDNLTPITSHKIHQSGINSYSYKIINNDNLLLLTGGDDNCVVLTVFKLFESGDNLAILKLSSFEDKEIHCTQITGAYLGDKYFITSSIDQRVVIWRWSNLGQKINFLFVQKYVTTIADPQGLECFSKDGDLNIFIYGNGIEHLKLKNHDFVW